MMIVVVLIIVRITTRGRSSWDISAGVYVYGVYVYSVTLREKEKKTGEDQVKYLYVWYICV